MPSTAKTVGKKSETDFFRSRLLINFENTKIKIADENSLTFLKNYDIVYIQIIQKEVNKEMVTRKEDTPQRIASRKYEERNKEKRRAASGNFQTMIPRDLYEEINAYLKKNKITKAPHGGKIIATSHLHIRFGVRRSEYRFADEEDRFAVL